MDGRNNVSVVKQEERFAAVTFSRIWENKRMMNPSRTHLLAQPMTKLEQNYRVCSPFVTLFF